MVQWNASMSATLARMKIARNASALITPPKQHPVLVGRRHGEVGEQHGEHEDRVDRQRSLDEVARLVLAGRIGALPGRHGHAERQTECDPRAGPGPPPPAPTPRVPCGAAPTGRAAAWRRRTPRTQPTP